MVNNRDAARAAQLEAVWEQNEVRAREMEQCETGAAKRKPYPEEYADWDMGLRYFALLAVYLDECKREGFLHAGKGPYYCGKCEEKQPGWTRMICWECAWPAFLRERAIEMAENWERQTMPRDKTLDGAYSDLVKVPA